MARWQPTRAQFYALSGLSAAACVPASRVVASVDPATDTFVLPGHGFDVAALLRFEAAVEDGVLPAPLVGSSLYEVAGAPGSDLFQVRTVGGSVVNITDVGTGPFRVIEDFGPKLDAILYARARWCDDHAIPYSPPTGTPPEGWPPDSLVLCSCKLAAVDVADVLRSSAPSYDKADLVRAAGEAQKFLDQLRAGKPLAVPPTDATPKTPELGARAFSRKPPRGWKVEAV